MPFPALIAALARMAASTGGRIAASRAAQATAAREAELAPWRAAQKANQTNWEKQVRAAARANGKADSFMRLFPDHPANNRPGAEPPPLPGRQPGFWEKAANTAEGLFQKQIDKWVKDPIGSATNSMSDMARQIDSGKSVGQGMIDALKRIDPTGLVGLASAGLDLAGAAAARGVNVGRKVVQDDFVGLMGEVLPDAAMKFISALRDLTNAIVERGRYLSKYDPNLATATATADVRRIQSEIREAQTVGRAYSRVIDQQSILENKLRDAFAPLKEAIADRLAAILEILNKLIDASFLKEAIAVFSEIQRVITAIISMDPEKILDAILNMPERIAKALFGGDDDQVDLNDVIKNALDDLKRMPGAPLADPKERKGANRFNFPIVKGA